MFSNLLTYLINLFGPTVLTIETKVAQTLIAIVGEQPADQTKILHDAMAQFTADRAAGKSYGEAAADALTVFFAEEKGEADKVTTQLFQSFLAATA